jgi:hypothetical protein
VQVVAFQHCSTALGSSSSGNPPPGGFFYVAYNLGGTCGGLVMISPSTNALTRNPLFCTAGSNGALRGFAVRVNPNSNGYPVAYVLLASGLYKLDTLQGTIPSQPPLIPASSSMTSLISISSQLLLSKQSHATTPLMVADIAQWTWVPITGMPEGTAPSLSYVAATGISPTTTLLVAAYGQRLFRLSTKHCALGKYWDGVGCVSHSCVKIQQCDATQELVNNQCVCLPGYYQPAKGGCLACPIGSFCRNGQMTACSKTGTLTTLAQYSTSANDCICSFTGHYYSAAADDCVQCLPHTWCPNRWVILACPAATSTSLTASSGNQYPVTCTCPPGFTGPMCAACPANSYCPASTAATVYNMAVLYTNITYAQAMPLLTQSLLNYFNSPGTRLSASSSTTFQDLQRILYVDDIRPTNRTLLPSIVVMLQLPTPSLQTWGNVLKLAFLSAGHSYVGTNPSNAMPVVQKDIPNNVPTQCLTGKVPSQPIASTCVCAPGYEANGQQCRPCAANTFKPAPGADTTCAPCPVGLPLGTEDAPSAGAASSIKSHRGAASPPRLPSLPPLLLRCQLNRVLQQGSQPTRLAFPR